MATCILVRRPFRITRPRSCVCSGHIHGPSLLGGGSHAVPPYIPSPTAGHPYAGAYPQSYVSGSKFGITAAEIKLVQFPGVSATVDWAGLAPPTNESPHTDAKTLTATFPLSAIQPKDGTRLTSSLRIQNGGYVELVGVKVPLANSQTAIGPQPATRDVVFDYTPPYATGNMFNRHNPEMSSDPILKLSAASWRDDASGIWRMRYQACPFIGGKKVLTYNPNACTEETVLAPQALDPNHVVNVNLGNQEGLFALLLTVYDKAKNPKVARRLVLHAKNPDDLITTDGVRELLVTSAGRAGLPFASGDKLWQTVRDRVEFDWTGVFKDTSSQQWLKEIADHDDVDAAYDEPTGSQISRVATPNKIGITKFEWQLRCPTGGAGASDFQLAGPDGLETRVTRQEQLSPGHRYIAVVRATNIWGRSKEREQEFLVDVTPPVVRIAGLKMGGKAGLNWHGEANLASMKLAFTAFDEESSLKRLAWDIKEEGNDGCTEAQSVCTPDVNTIALTACSEGAPGCVCTPANGCKPENYEITGHQNLADGEHGRAYTVIITATNGASQATTSEPFVVRVDTTPPLVGTVRDGPAGGTDQDFQQSRKLQGWWSGFNDPDSGVSHYKYIFSTTKSTEVTDALRQRPLLERTVTFPDEFTAPAPNGTWYLCVVAYNNAGAESNVACSDGVKTDQSPPVMKSLFLLGSARSNAGVAKDGAGNYWAVRSDSTRQQIIGVSEYCASRPTASQSCCVAPLENLIVYRPANASITAAEACPDAAALVVQFFQPSSTVVSLAWAAETPANELKGFEFGLSSTAQGEPDIAPFQSVGLLTSFVLKHAGLRAMFYVQVKATKLAKTYTVVEIGPVFVDATPPSTGGVTAIPHPTGLELRWSAFSDSEPQSTLEYEIGVGSTPEDSDDITAFRPIGDPLGVCGTAVGCATVSAPQFGGLTEVFAKVKACNPAGLCAVASAKSATPTGSKPGIGRVLDVRAGGNNADIAFQSFDADLLIMVSGFTGGNLKYSVAVGTDKFQDDVQAFSEMPIVQNQHVALENLPLTVGKSYFTTVRASNAYGTAMASSNGVTALGTGALPKGTLSVADGEGCDQRPDLPIISPAGSSEVRPGLPLVLQANLLHIGHSYTIVSNSFATIPALTLSSMGVLWPLNPAADRIEFVALAVNMSLALNVPSGSGSATVLAVRLLECSADLIAQSHTDYISVSWAIPETVATTSHVLYFQHAVEVQDGSSSWASVRPWETTVDATANTIFLKLIPGSTYRSLIRACHPAGCYASVTSNGVAVVASELESGQISATYTQPFPHGGTTNVLVSWQDFTDDGGVVRPLYQWAVASDDSLSDLITEWVTVVPNSDSSDTMTVHHLPDPADGLWAYQVDAVLEHDFSLYDSHNFLYVFVRGFGYAGTTTIGIAAFEATSLLRPELRVAVVDLTQLPLPGAVRLEDIEYTSQANDLAAAWSGLWPEFSPDFYEWSISVNRRFTPCANVSSSYCGRSFDKFAAAEGLDLVHGSRYFFCVRAGPTTLYEGGLEADTIPAPPNVSCSNGITVDMTPPIAGSVILGYPSAHVAATANSLLDESAVYQRGTSELVLRWHGFVDVEEYDNVPHTSGIAAFTVMIGSAPGSGDVWSSRGVGAATHLIARNLNLKSGSTYYATVTATDYAGLSTTVTSRGVTIDTTPPSATAISVVQHDGSTGSQLIVEWSESIDVESIVVEYVVGVGATPGSGDIVPFTSAGTMRSMAIQLSSVLTEGHSFAVTVKAINAVGAVRSSSSHTLQLDLKPPVVGVVRAVDPAAVLTCTETAPCAELHYAQQGHSMAATWTGFSDVVGIEEYGWAIGTAPGLTDIRGFEWLPSSASSAVASSLSLHDGTAYYATVRACDAQQRCVSASSMGFTPDSTPPIPGLVLDGFGENDADYQVDLNVIGASWEGFHDPHSEIARYEWCASSTDTPNQCDVVSYQTVGLSTRGVATVFNSGKKIGAGDINRLFITVRATNGAGLMTVVRSDGVQVDDTAPSVAASAQLVPVHSLSGAFSQPGEIAYQLSRSALRATWDFTPVRPGPLSVQYTISTHTNAANPVPVPVRTYSTTGALVAGLALADGDIYYVQASACDAANLCSLSTDQVGVMVDTTRPVTAGWGSLVDSAKWSWTQNTIQHLTWTACADDHSDIQHYTIAVGTDFGTSDLVAPQVLPSTQLVGTFQLNAGKRLVAQTSYFVTLTCTNNAGLPSEPMHAQVKTLASGGVRELELQRHSCAVVGCTTDAEEHRQCSCGATAEFCHQDEPLPPCAEAKLPATLVVLDGFSTADENAQYDTSVLRAHWKWDGGWAAQVGNVRVQYSVLMGTQRAPQMPVDRDWFDLPSRATEAVFLVPDGDKLTPGQTYSMRIRVWENHVSFSEYQSDGVHITPNSPHVSRTERLIEKLGETDTDHQKGTEALTVSWAGRPGRGTPVFFKDPSNPPKGASFVIHECAVGTLPGAADVRPFQQISAADVSSKVATITELSLKHGQKYWMSIRVTDAAGLSSVATTDGLRIDSTPPVAVDAVVLDGNQPSDIDFQDGSSPLRASWYGFSDPESGIRGYKVSYTASTAKPKCADPGARAPCVVPTVEHPEDRSWVDVGMAVSRQVLAAPVAPGRYHIFVKAYNILGDESAAVVSDSLVVDNTPPVAAACSKAGLSLVKSGSFEGGAVGWTLVDGAIRSTGIDNAETGVNNGVASLLLSGPLSRATQVLISTPGAAYILSFSARLDVDIGVFGSATAVVFAGGDIFRVKVKQDQPHDEPRWQQFEYHFTAESASTELQFAASAHASYTPGLLIDTISVKPCSTPDAGTSPISAGPAFQSSVDTISAWWSVADLESDISESFWAVGSTPGGVQLQPYVSVGRQSHAIVSNLVLQHNSMVYVSVAVRNGAGATKRFISSEVLIDHTPPTLGGIMVGKVQFDTSSVTVGWPTAIDPESAISGCSVGFGRLAGSTELVGFTKVSRTELAAAQVTMDVSESGAGDRDVLFATVRCLNGAGLQSTASSQPFVVLATAPANRDAIVRILPSQATASFYPASAGWQTGVTQIKAEWSGFGNAGDPLRYELELRGEGATAGWRAVGERQQALLSGLALSTGRVYTVAVRAIDATGRSSGEMTARVKVDASPPTTVPAGSPCTTVSSGVTHLSWSGVFSDSACSGSARDECLQYEVAVGVSDQAPDLLGRTATATSSIELSSSRAMNTSPLFVTLTAINGAGLSTTARFEVTPKLPGAPCTK